MNAHLSYSFLLGVVAAVNPCGFAMLPAYIAYFLNSENDPSAPGTARAPLGRALVVGALLTSGFVVVFLLVGLAVRSIGAFADLPEQARWAGLAIGIAMVIAGVAMTFGWRPRTTTAGLISGVPRNRTMRSMFLFGIAYATASIGCTIGLFLSAVLGSFTRDGFVSGVASIAAYALGMGALVTIVTIAAALTRQGLGDRLRWSSRRSSLIAGPILAVTGLYLSWYWFAAIFRPTSRDGVTSRVGSWQTQVSVRLQTLGSITLGTMALVLIFTAVAVDQIRAKQANRSGSQ